MTVTKHWVGASLWRLSPHYSLFTWLWLSIGLVLHPDEYFFFSISCSGFALCSNWSSVSDHSVRKPVWKSSISMIRKDKCWVFVLLNFLNGTKTKAKSYCFAWNSTISVYISYDLIYVKVREIFPTASSEPVWFLLHVHLPNVATHFAGPISKWNLDFLMIQVT